MYNPIVGRWMEEDPIDLKAGDGNLYRDVGNNPTNLVDWTGLDGTPVEGTGKRVLNKQITYKGKESWVRVYVNGNVWVDTRDPKGEPTKQKLPEKAPYFFIQIQFTAPAGVQDCHWLQFVTGTETDVNNRPIEGLRRVRYRKDGTGKEWARYSRLGQPNIDSWGPSPFYDLGQGLKRRTNTEISIFDRPTHSPNIDDWEVIKEKRMRFDDYLVSGDTVLYHVHWEFVTKPTTTRLPKSRVVAKIWKSEYDLASIKGEVVDRLPGYALGDKLLGSYEDEKKLTDEDRLKFDNPISKPTREKWKK
jgi:hypothetical protein